MPMTLLALALPSADSLGKIAIFLFMLSVLVVIHEGGHFWLARWNGVRVNDFAVGFGPTLLKWTSKKTGTNYRLNALPLGGYCAMQGEDGVTSEAEQQRQFRAEANDGLLAEPAAQAGAVATLAPPPIAQTAFAIAPGEPSVAASDNFQAKNPWQRLSIVVAGPVANFILAYAILTVGAMTFGVVTDKNPTAMIGPITSGSAGEKAGLQVGDVITAIDGKAYPNGSSVIDKIKASANVPLVLTLLRHGEHMTVNVTPEPKKDEKTGKIVGRIGFVVIPSYVHVAPLEAFSLAGSTFVYVITSSISGLSQIPSHLSSVHGVIGMGQAAQQVQDLGWPPYFNLAAQISIGLGILNLLPFPALDGGRGIFIIAEMLRGRPVDAEKEALVHVTGFAVLMVLMAFVAFHDILNIVNGKSIFQ